MRLLIIAAFIFALAFSASAWDEPADFRGLKWGLPESEVRETIKSQWQKRRDAGQIVVFEELRKAHQEPNRFTLSYRDNIGQTLVDLSLHFLDGRFMYAMVIFAAKDFERIKAAFLDRYGNPSKSRVDELQTKMGARYKSENLQWVGTTVWVQLKEYGPTVKEGYADIGKIEFIQSLQRSQRQKDSEASKDL